MSGVRLLDLDSSDLFDVIHYIFEEDATQSSTAEQAEARDSMRVTLYRSLYNVNYQYAYKATSTANNFSMLDDPLDALQPNSYGDFDPSKSGPPKPYIPATDFSENSVNPYAVNKLDAPLN